MLSPARGRPSEPSYPASGGFSTRPARRQRCEPLRGTLRLERKEANVGITVSILLAAAGAILIWAVNTTSSGFNVHTAGVILLVVGIIGFVLSLAFWSSWG